MADREQPYDPYVPAGQHGGANAGQGGNQRTAQLQAVGTMLRFLELFNLEIRPGLCYDAFQQRLADSINIEDLVHPAFDFRTSRLYTHPTTLIALRRDPKLSTSSIHGQQGAVWIRLLQPNCLEQEEGMSL